MNTKKTWIAAFILLGTLLLGMVFGSTITVSILAKKVKDKQPSSFAFRHEHFLEKVINRMDRSLELTPEQKEKIRPELRKMAEEFKSLHNDTGKKMNLIRENGEKALFAHFTKEQVEKYKKDMWMRHDRMRRDHEMKHRFMEKRKHAKHHKMDYRDHEHEMPPPPPPPPEE